MEQRICKQCGRVFVYHGHKSGDHTKFCSDECSVKAKREANLRSYYKSQDCRERSQLKQREKRAHEADENRRQWLDNNVPDGFEYLGDWVGGNTEVSFKCLRHGVVVRRTIDAVRQHGGIRCEICRREYQEEYQKEYQKRRNTYGSREEYLAELARQREKREQERRESIKCVFVCDVCGKKFVTYNPRQKRCSLKCSKAKRAERQGHRHRARKYGCEYDPSVTTKRLIERDGLRCAICGEMCDQNDHRWSEWFGPLYPTLDHIIPLSKGGSHAWDNVQVAHAICNATKRDLVEGEPEVQTEKSRACG